MGRNKMAKTSWGIIAILALLGILIYLFIKKPSGQVSSSPSYDYTFYISGLGGSGGLGGSSASTSAPPTYAYGISGISQLESVYGSSTPIYYNPFTKIAQINPPARSNLGGRGAVYLT
jgi:hypothetical protein